MIETTPAPATPPHGLSAQERSQLLAIAKASLCAALQREPSPDVEGATPLLEQNGAVFVSLYNGDELRGCIGTFSRVAPLWQQVQRMTLMAASEDPRFAPIRDDEGDQISFELSVLSKPTAIEGPEEVVIGRDGLVISNTKHRGVLLPQVATKNEWDAETFLSHTCRKAGLPPDAWLKPTVLMERFEADVFAG